MRPGMNKALVHKMVNAVVAIGEISAPKAERDQDWNLVDSYIATLETYLQDLTGMSPEEFTAYIDARRK